VVKEAEQEIGPASESSESSVGLLANLCFGLGGGVPHVLRDLPRTIPLRVQLRGGRGQPLHVALRMLSQQRLDWLRPMPLQAVPTEDHRTVDPTPEMTQQPDQIRPVDRMVKMFLGNPARQGQPDRRVDLTSLAHASQEGRPPLGGPRRTGPQVEREPRLIEEDDHRTPAASLFLRRGQSRLSHAWINSSSRSRAPEAGTWTLQPKSFSRTER